VPVPEEDLPVEHPYLDDFRPDDSGVSPLARAKDWYETACPRCAGPAHRDADVTDNFLCSGWYFLRYPSTDRSDMALDPELTRKWLPVDCYIGGNEHAVLHLMYARFLTMALSDMGEIEFDEPFARFRANGLLIRDGRKMSKSRGNVIVPDRIIDQYGADTMRMYLLFLGPYEQVADYQSHGIQGPHGFLSRLWQCVLEAQGDDESAPDAAVERALHRTIKQLSEQVPTLQYNTAIAAMMEYLNVVRARGRRARKAEVAPLVVMLAPFAPHIAEELYARLGHDGGLFETARWPRYDEAKTVADTAEMAVQVNGKVRGRITVAADLADAGVIDAAKQNENVARHLAGKTLRKTIVVPGRLVNLVVG
jgi:leucyl-tRNA synthetase